MGTTKSSPLGHVPRGHVPFTPRSSRNLWFDRATEVLTHSSHRCCLIEPLARLVIEYTLPFTTDPASMSLYVVGGIRQADAESYDADADVWTDCPSMRYQRRVGLAGYCVRPGLDPSCFMFGGQEPGFYFDYVYQLPFVRDFDMCPRYVPAAGSWALVPLGEPVSDVRPPVLAAYDGCTDKIYLFRSSGHSVLYYNCASRTFHDLPTVLIPGTGSSGASIVVVDRRMYLIGGGRGGRTTACFDCQTLAWIADGGMIPDLPQPLEFHAACVWPNRGIVVTGGSTPTLPAGQSTRVVADSYFLPFGRGPSHPTGTTVVFDHVWVPMPPLNDARRHHIVQFLSGTMFAVGGQTLSTHGDTLNSVERFVNDCSPTRNVKTPPNQSKPLLDGEHSPHWIRVAAMNTDRHSFASFVV